jgi:hypothetical protein
MQAETSLAMCGLAFFAATPLVLAVKLFRLARISQ